MREDRGQAGVGQRRPERRRQRGEEQALGQQLADEAAAAGAERDSHAHLALPRRWPSTAAGSTRSRTR